MDLRRVRSFVTVAEQGSVSKAALRLHITQPALSRQIQDFQRELGLKLFERVGRGIVLTSEGEQLLTECRALLTHAETIGERARTLQRGDTGTLKVAASPVQIEAVLSGFLHRYAERFPKVDLRVIEAVGPDILGMLERGDIHLGILLHAVQAEDRPFGRYVVPPVELLAVCQPSFQLKFGKTIDIRALAPYPLLLLDSGFVVRKTFDAVCRLAKIKPKIVMESRAPSNLLALAEAGHGIAVVPSVVRTHRYRLRVARITHEGRPLREPLSIMWDSRRVLPRYARDFCALLAAHMRTLGSRNPRAGRR
ncbi:MAG TPA: LysR family transcriptional regulator [Pseudolabrys sp.]|nr:LysR family transcriptional regulator [Pseudolabrys sp.]